MKYCRYCAYCICGDVYYCTEHEKVLNNVNKVTSCENFVLSELGDVDTGKSYKPHEPKEVTNAVTQQALLEDFYKKHEI